MGCHNWVCSVAACHLGWGYYSKILTHNKGFQTIGAKARLSLNPDVGPRSMTHRIYSLILLVLVCIWSGCRTNKHNSSHYIPYEWPTPQLTTLRTNQIQDIALTIAKAHGYDLALYAQPKIYYQPVPGNWSAFFGGITEASGSKSFFVFIEDKSLNTSIYELDNQKAQQAVPGYPPQGVGSPDP